MMLRLQRFVLLLAVSLVAACGGGGGGGGSSTGGGSSGGGAPGGSSSSPVALSTTNAPNAAAAVADAAFLVTGTSEPLASVPTGVVVSGGSSFKLNEFLSTQLQTINNIKASITPMPVGVQTTTTLNCSLGGTMSIGLNDADNSGSTSTGDTFTLTFASCNEDGAVLNGGISASNLVLTKTSATAYAFSGLITISNLTYADGFDSGALTVAMTFSETTSDSVTFTSTLNISSLAATGTETMTITNLNTTIVENRSTGAYSLSIASGTINSAKLGGTVTVVTLSPLQAIGAAYPHAGSVKITGATSSVTLTALSNTNVRITVDSNNDGVTDGTILKTWAELEAI